MSEINRHIKVTLFPNVIFALKSLSLLSDKFDLNIWFYLFTYLTHGGKGFDFDAHSRSLVHQSLLKGENAILQIYYIIACAPICCR